MLGLKVLIVHENNTEVGPCYQPVSWLRAMRWPTDGRWVQGRCWCADRTVERSLCHGLNGTQFPPSYEDGNTSLCGLHVMFDYLKLLSVTQVMFVRLTSELSSGRLAVFMVELSGRVVIHENGARAEKARLLNVVKPHFLFYEGPWSPNTLGLPVIRWDEANKLVCEANAEAYYADW